MTDTNLPDLGEVGPPKSEPTKLNDLSEIKRQESDDNCGSGEKDFKCGEEGHMVKDFSEPSLDADGKPGPPSYKPDLIENDKSLFDTASAEKNSDSYNGMPGSVSENDVPSNSERRETLEESSTETILNGLKQSPIEEPTPIQKDGIQIVIADGDAMACDQTNFDSHDEMQCSSETNQKSESNGSRQESDDKCRSDEKGFECGEVEQMVKDCSEPSLDTDEKPRSIYQPPDLSKNDKSLFDTASTGENFDSHNEMPCSVSEKDVPSNSERHETLEESSTTETILNGLEPTKIEKTTPIREDDMKIVMADGDAIACDQTNFDSFDEMQCSIENDQNSEPNVSLQDPASGPNGPGKSGDSDGGWGDPSPSEIKPEPKPNELKQESDDTWGSGGEKPSGGGDSSAANIIKTENDGGDPWKSQSGSNGPGKSGDSDGGWGDPSPSASKPKPKSNESRQESGNTGGSGGWGDPSPSETKPKPKSTESRQGSGDTWGGSGGWGDPSPSESKPKPKSTESRQESGDTWGGSGGWGDPSPSETKPKPKSTESRQGSGDTWGGSGGWGDPSPSETKSKPKSTESRQESGDTWGGSGGWGDPTPSSGGGGSWADAGSGGADWGSTSFGASDRGKSGGSSGKGCFKCGEEGHMSRECPKGGGSSRGGSGKGCFKCGEEGHMSRECPSGGGSSRGGGGGKGCFKCGEEGHMSRECPKGGGSSRGGSGKGCFKCGEEGHMSRECPSGGGSSRGGGGKGCFKCGEEGHMSRECTKGGRRGFGEDCAASPAKKNCTWGASSGSNGSTAKNSTDDSWGGSWGDPSPSESKPKPKSNNSQQESGDTWGGSWGDPSPSESKPKPKSNESQQESGDTWGSGGGASWADSGSSPKKSGGNDWGTSSGFSDKGKSSGSGGKGCFKCGEEGHMSRECPKGGGSGSRGKGCHKCGKEGHMAKDCSEPSLDADGKPRPPIYKPPDLSENDESLFDTAAAGENFDSYDGMPCSVSGEDVPKDPERYETFEEAFTSETILNGLKQSKIKKPTPIQKYGMRIVMAGRDLMACAQTGSGKTLAFILPILQDLFNDKDLRSGYGEMPSKPKALIISPTRELAVQIYKEAYKYSRGSIVKVQIIYGGTSVGHQRAKLSEGAHILVGTAGRLLDFLDKNYYDFSELKYLVLDEADRMIDQGFIPDVRKMIIHPTMPPKEKRQTLMFSATFPNAVQKVAGEFLVSNYLFLTVGILGAANSDVHQTLLKVEKFSKRNKLLEILKESDNNDRTMIFVESKKTADFLASFLSQSDYRATSIHGDRYQRQREEALDDLKSGKFPILVATSVASRGLDIKDVRHVINYDLPKEIDDYIHRIGRTGRVGNKGKATSFYDPDADKALAAKIVEVIKSASQPVPDWLNEETAEGQSGNGIAFGGIDYRGESGTSDYQDLDAPQPQSNFDLEW